MSVLDENPLENVPIDIFAAAGFSNEELDFQVDPEAQEPPREDNSPLNQLPVQDIEEERGHVDIDDAVSPAEITDTPENPIQLDVDEDDVTLISLEDDPELNEEMASLESLYAVYDRLKEIGGISQNDVYQIEALHPGAIPNGDKLGRFSSSVTLTGYDVSMEGLARTIVEKVKAILRYIADKIRQLGRWIGGRKDKLLGIDSNLKGNWQTALDIARKVDSNDGTKLLRTKYKDNDIARKSSNVQHFIKLVAQDTFSKLGPQYITAFESIITNGSIVKEMFALSTKVKQNLNIVQTNLTRVKSNNYVMQSTAVIVGDANATKGEIAAKYSKPFKAINKTFEAAVNVSQTDYNSTVGDLDDISRSVNDISRAIEQLERSVKPTDQAISKAITTINQQVVELNAMYSVLDLYLDYFRRYNRVVNHIIIRTRMLMVPLGGLKPQ